MVKAFLLTVLFLFCPATGKAAQQRLVLQFEPPPEKTYIGQETSFKISLLDRIGLRDIGIVPVDWPNSDIFLRNTLQGKSVTHNGASYEKNEWYFSLVAKSVGKMVFPPFCLIADAPTLISERDLPDSVAVLPTGQIRICAPSFSIEVRPLPNHSSPLFAATRVQLFDGVVPETSSVPVGTPVKRSLLLAARGTLPVFLPDFRTGEMTNARVYNGKTERTMPDSKDSLSAALRQTVIFIPQQPGKLVLPEMKVSWLNTKTNRIETSVVPAYTLTILPDPKTDSKTSTEKLSPRETEKPDVSGKPFDYKNKLFFAAIGVVFVLCAFLLFRNLKKSRARSRLVKAVEKACLNEEPEQIAAAILAWSRTMFPRRAFLSLADVRTLFEGRSDIFVQRLTELEMFLYGTGRFAKYLPAAKESLGKNVLDAFMQIVRIDVSERPVKEKLLPDLYPNDDSA